MNDRERQRLAKSIVRFVDALNDCVDDNGVEGLMMISVIGGAHIQKFWEETKHQINENYQEHDNLSGPIEHLIASMERELENMVAIARKYFKDVQQEDDIHKIMDRVEKICRQNSGANKHSI